MSTYLGKIRGWEISEGNLPISHPDVMQTADEQLWLCKEKKEMKNFMLTL